MLAKSEEFTEIGVGSHDDSRFRTSEAQELTVACTAAAKVGDDVDRVMASHTKRFRNSVRETFVKEELHALSRSGSCRSSTAAAA